MGIRIYLDEKNEELVKIWARQLKDEPGTNNFLYRGIRISCDRMNGIHYAEVQNITSEIPPELTELVDFVTSEETFGEVNGNFANREQGIYRQGTAEAELTLGFQGNEYRLKIKATKLEDLRALYVAIRSGSIRPEQSYETPQAGLSGQEILAKLEKTEQELKQSEEKFQALVNAFKNLISDLKIGYWSFCTKKRMIKAIEAIFSVLNLAE